MERAVRLAAGDPDLHQSRRRLLRPAARHPGRNAGDGGDLRRGAPAMDHHDRPWRSRVGPLLHHGDRLLVHGPGAEVSGARDLPGCHVSHGTLAARGRRFHRPARGRDRHRILRHPVDPDHCGAGRAPVRLPAHAELQRARPQRASGPGLRATGEGRLRRLPAPGARVARRLRRRAQRGLRARGGTRGTAARIREALEPRRPRLYRDLRGLAAQQGRQ